MAKIVQEMAFGKGRKKAAKVVNRDYDGPINGWPQCPFPDCSKRDGHDLGVHDLLMYNATANRTKGQH